MRNIVLLLFAVCAVIPFYFMWGEAGVYEQPLTFSSPRFAIVDLTAYAHSEKTILTVSGNVENQSQSLAKGYVIIYLKKGGDVILALETSVNSGAPFAHGTKGYFETSVNLTNLSQRPNNILVEFVDR
ncbi:MAG: hypothetical protein ABWK15_01715 [Dissulfuribacterales bacterium]